MRARKRGGWMQAGQLSGQSSKRPDGPGWIGVERWGVGDPSAALMLFELILFYLSTLICVLQF